MRQIIRHPAIKNIEFTPKTLVHDHQIDWPNGKGHTPCTKEYHGIYHAKLAIYDPADGGNIDDLAPEDYQHWCELDNRVMGMSLDGHIGKSVRY